MSAGWTLVRQRALLAELARAEGEEKKHLRGQAWRRLACGILMALLGVMLAGALLFLEAPAEELGEKLANQGPVTEPEDRGFARFYGWYWVTFLLLMLALVVLAGVDLWAVWRNGLRQLKQLQQERRDMIAHEATHLRQRRLGESNGQDS
jgi:MFS family permease